MATESNKSPSPAPAPAVSSRKRNVSDMLNIGSFDCSAEYGSSQEPPRTRPKLEQTLERAREKGATQNDTDSTSQPEEMAAKDHVNMPEPTMFSYPDLAKTKPRAIPFQQPSQLLSFSYTPEHVQEFTDSALRYYVDPPLGSSLAYGLDRWIRKPDERGRIDALLKAVSKINHDAERGGGSLPEISVISWRGIITKILTAPYENRDDWDLNVMLVNGTLYLEEHLTDERLNEKNNMSARQLSQTYYGYAFESYCTSESPPGKIKASKQPGVPRGWGGDVNTNVQWCSVVRTKLGNMRMIMGGEVDCVRGKYTGKTDTFVELKTSLTIRGKQDEERFEKKLLKFYFQSFLLGVPEIVVGFRTPAGVVTTVQSFKTIELPRMVRGKAGAWDPAVCLDWASGFLTHLKDVVSQGTVELDASDHNVSPAVWRAKFIPNQGVSVTRLDSKGVADVENGEERVGFLPRWYWDEIRQTRTAERMAMPTMGQAGWKI